MPTQNFLDFLNLPVKQLIYLADLTLSYISGGAVLTEKIYCGTAGYNTTGTESPANTPYRAVLGRSFVPSFRQEMTLPFSGTLSKPGSATLRLINVGGIFNAKMPPARVWEGRTVSIKLTGPRSQLALADAAIVYRGVMDKPRFSQSVIEVELFLRHRELERKKMPTATFTAPNGETKLAPLAFGFCNNVTAPLKDAVSTTNIIFKLSGVALEDVTACYDKGVALTPTTQWTKDLANGEAALKQAAVGAITWDIKGIKFGSPATFSAKRGDFIKWALENPGGIAAADLDAASFTTFNTDVSGDSGIYITEETSVLDFCKLMLEPVMGDIIQDREGIFSVILLKLPVGTPTLTLTATHLLPLGDNRNLIEQIPGEPQLYQTVLLFDLNNTVQDSGTLGSTGAVDPATEAGRKRREWLLTEWRTAMKSLTGATQGRNLIPTAGEITLPSFFINKADADTFAQRWLDFFGGPWSLYRCEAKVQPFKAKLHDVVRISDDVAQIVNKDTRAISYEENHENNRIGLTLFARD